MDKVEWNQSLSVGVDVIDRQHKMLIGRLNDLNEALKVTHGPAEVVKTISFMMEYADFHFATEEKHMAATQFPGLGAQQKAHEEFRAAVKRLEEDFDEEGATHSMADALETLLVKWLFKHIRDMDAKFGVFLKEKGIVLSGED